MRRRHRWALAAHVVSVAIFVPVGIVAIYGSIAGNLLLSAFFVLVAVITLISAARQVSRNRRVDALVPRADGMVCPACIRAMNASTDGHMVCPRCNRRSTPEALREHWIAYGTQPERTGETLATFKKQRDVGQTEKRWTFRSWKVFVPFLIGSFILLTGVFSAAMGQSILVAIIEHSPMMIMVSGIMLIQFRWVRQGDQRRCAACEYLVPPAGPVSTACPECGEDWMAADAFVRGDRAATRTHVVVGVCLALIGFALMFGGGGSRAWSYRLLPTSALIRATVQDDGFTMNQWNEIRRRSLSDDQTVALAQGLLEKRLRKGYLGSDAQRWFEAQLALGTLPADESRRYTVEHVNLTLDGPATAAPVETVRVRVVGDYRQSTGVVLAVGDFAVNGVPIPGSRQQHVVYGLDFHDVDPDISAEFTMPIAATARVTLDYWVFLASGFRLSGARVQWNADGTPVPPQGVGVGYRVTVERLITATSGAAGD